jgi:hypothetical protein
MLRPKTKRPTPIKTEITGTLEIDHYRGVIYFHAAAGRTILRICLLPTPIPMGDELIDITYMHPVGWRVWTPSNG